MKSKTSGTATASSIVFGFVDFRFVHHETSISHSALVLLSAGGISITRTVEGLRFGTFFLGGRYRYVLNVGGWKCRKIALFH